MSCQNRTLLLEAGVLLSLAELAAHTLPFCRIIRLARLPQTEAALSPEPKDTAPVRRVRWAVRTATRHLPWRCQCLAQALTAYMMLARRGAASTLYIGVRLEEQRGAELACLAAVRLYLCDGRPGASTVSHYRHLWERRDVSAIFGVFDLQERPVERSHLALMDEALRACGPDGAQLWHDGAVGLGQRLLQTTPAAHLEPRPPMGPGQTCVLVVDARLDNRMELGAHFGIAPAALSNVPDSALILVAYEKWGEACSEHLLGDFAFALWDHRTRTLFAARDPLGIKPFYYCHIPGRLVALASQMAGLLSHPLVPRRLNDLRLAYHMVMHKADPEITFFADCWRLPPAHTLRVRKGELHLHRYWVPDPAREIRLESDTEYVEACRALLRQAMGDRLPINARVGAHLTGGLDSSTAICLAASRLREAVQSLMGFSWTTLPQPTDDPEEGELPFIAAVCAQAGITRYAPQITPEAMRDVILLRSGQVG